MSHLNGMSRWARIAMLSLLLAVPAQAADKLVVKVGASADAATEAKSTDLTVDALKSAEKAKDKTGFSVTDASGAARKLSLSAKEAADILGGTTVVAETDGGGPKVWISFVAEKKAAPAPDAGSGGGGGW